jgi:spectrin alpha
LTDLFFTLDPDHYSLEYPLSFQAKIQKHQAFEAEVAAHCNAIEELDKEGYDMINSGHYASQTIQEILDRLHKLWELLLRKLQDKGLRLQQALQLIQFIRECDEVMFWISDKVRGMIDSKFKIKLLIR